MNETNHIAIPEINVLFLSKQKNVIKQSLLKLIKTCQEEILKSVKLVDAVII